MLIGYGRTSTTEQVAELEAQEAALAATGCSKLFVEQVSSVAQRDQLAAARRRADFNTLLSRAPIHPPHQ